MGIEYAREKLATAVRNALLHDGALQKRLASALSTNVRLLIPEHRHMPINLQKRFDAMLRACTRKGGASGVRGAIAATVPKMTEKEARKWLDELLTLYACAAESLY